MLGAKAPERPRDLPAQHRLLEVVDGRSLDGQVVAVRERRAGAGAALHVDDSVACNRIEPGSDGGTPLVVAVRMLPRAGEDVLHDLLGQVSITQCIAREAVELARVATVKLAQIVATLVTGERLDKARVAAFHLVHGIRARSLCGSDRVQGLCAMLFTAHDLRRVAAGEITVAFRRWRRPTVKAGGTLRTRAGVLAIESLDEIEREQITDADARRAGRDDRAAVLAGLRGDGRLYRVRFHLAGPDPRIALRERADLSAAERSELDGRLARLDAASRHGPWTARVLRLIADRPATRAADLAAELRREKAPFKADVRKLKELGLTESLEVGYRLSPRGRAYLGSPT
jgi:hypothetical protein